MSKRSTSDSFSNTRKGISQRRVTMCCGDNIHREQSTPFQHCSCNADSLEEELRELQSSSKEAISVTWDQVEYLQKHIADSDKQIEATTRSIKHRRDELERSTNRIKELTIESKILESCSEPTIIDKDKSSTQSFASSIRTLDPQSYVSRENPQEQELEDSSINHVDDSGWSVSNKAAEVRSLQLALISRNVAIESIERTLQKNVQQMQTFQKKINYRFQE